MPRFVSFFLKLLFVFVNCCPQKSPKIPRDMVSFENEVTRSAEEVHLSKKDCRRNAFFNIFVPMQDFHWLYVQRLYLGNALYNLGRWPSSASTTNTPQLISTLLQNLDGGSSALVIGVLVETDFEASKTLCLKAFWSLKIALNKARLLKHDLPVHGKISLSSAPVSSWGGERSTLSPHNAPKHTP